jgi:hypothetical protein
MSLKRRGSSAHLVAMSFFADLEIAVLASSLTGPQIRCASTYLVEVLSTFSTSSFSKQVQLVFRSGVDGKGTLSIRTIQPLIS